MTKEITTAAVAKMIKKELTAAFKGTKFSVTSDRYAGGSAVRVNWTGGAGLSEVKEIVSKYEGAGFDGMIDMKYYKSHAINKVTGELVCCGSEGTADSGGVYSSWVEELGEDWEEVTLYCDFVTCSRLATLEEVEAALEYAATEWKIDVSGIETHGEGRCYPCKEYIAAGMSNSYEHLLGLYGHTEAMYWNNKIHRLISEGGAA
tara:strand:- start:13392 stop:14003 length:612 start_codon:yes stop_codon:yes gene_type:complete